MWSAGILKQQPYIRRNVQMVFEFMMLGILGSFDTMPQLF